MHSFEVHSNESASRKKVCLGLEQVIWEQYSGGDGSDAESIGGFPSSVSPSYYGNDRLACGGRRVELPPVSDSLESEGICPIKEYFQRCQATITAQVACRPIYELCTGLERIPGLSV